MASNGIASRTTQDPSADAESLRIATVQFEGVSGDKRFNIARIRHFVGIAALSDCNVVSFHECCIPGYTWAQHLSKEELLNVAENVPGGQSTQELISIAKEFNIIVLAGLFEKEDTAHEGTKIYNTYICATPENGGQIIAKHRKLHPFISTHLSAGDTYTVFSIGRGQWKCGILICYDNNIIENVRATALQGAEVIFMPHVTMCTPSTRPGAGFVDPRLWHAREMHPAQLRAEFNGPKGREWLMKWLPARAYDNGVFVVFSNPIGMEDDQVKNGCSMILDPYGNILSECTALGDDMVSALCHRGHLTRAGGFRYRDARRPELYRHLIGSGHESAQNVAWLKRECP